MKTTIIVNPHAGGGVDLVALRAAINDRPELTGAEFLVCRERGEARALARTAAQGGAKLLVAAGGDGTLNEVLNGLGANSSSRLGLIPLGTANDFARTLGLEARLDAALDALTNDRSRSVDVIRVTAEDGGSNLFINASAGGFSQHVDGELDHPRKRVWGPLAYLRSAVNALPEVAPYHVSLEIDGAVVERDAVNVVLANGRHIAAGIPVAPEADVSDGRLDFVLIEHAPVPRLLALGALVLAGKHLGDDLIVAGSAERGRLTAEPAMWFNIDGEDLGESPFEFEVIPGGVDFAA
jgi:diacylglycerol kinase (ATP)